MAGITILLGDVRDKLRELPSDHFDCVVTSPPYWGLRDYGVAGQIGLEPTLGEHLAVMVDVFREVRRVLKPAGTLWLNYGDCYATAPNGRSAADTKAANVDDRTFRDKPFSTVGPIYETGQSEGHVRGRQGRSGNLGNGGINGKGLSDGRIVAGGTLKPKDLCLIPARLAIALQDDGWWVRSRIIWGKPNPMPDSSGLYRPAMAYEEILLLTKSDEGGFWVARDTHKISTHPDLSERCLAITTGKPINRWIELGHYYNAEAVRIARATASDGKKPDGWDTGAGGHGSHHRNGRESGEKIDKQRGHSRRHAGFNDRWDAMDKAQQCSRGRNLRNCEPAPLPVWTINSRGFKQAHFATFPPELVERCLLAGCPRGGAVLDPFGGAGTTALVAKHLGYSATLIELNPSYVEDIADVRLHRRAPKSCDGPLFETSI